MSDAADFGPECGAAGQRVASYCRGGGGWLPAPVRMKKGEEQ
jgi:hypothetical protein